MSTKQYHPNVFEDLSGSCIPVIGVFDVLLASFFLSHASLGLLQWWWSFNISLVTLWFLTIFIEGANLTFKSIFHKALPQFILVRLWNHARIRSWNQPVLSNNEFLAQGNNGDLWWCSNPRPPHYEYTTKLSIVVNKSADMITKTT